MRYWLSRQIWTTLKLNPYPLILASTLAMTWSGSNNIPQHGIDILVSSSHHQAILDDLLAGEWRESELSSPYGDHSIIKQGAVSETWLKACIEDL